MRPSDSPEQDAAAAVGVKRAEFGRFALENLFEISPDAIFITDGEGVIREANPRAKTLYRSASEGGIRRIAKIITLIHARGKWALP
jgi:PAS domain-containing protein